MQRQTHISNPASELDETEIEWYLEEHALHDPYLVQRAQKASTALEHYRDELARPLKATLQEIVGHHLSDTLRFLHLEVQGESSTSGFQSLHGELLETVDWEVPLRLQTVVSRCIRTTQKQATSTARTDGLDLTGDLNILFVTARPLAEKDVDYLLLSKPLVNLVRSPTLQARCNIDLVRPGSWWIMGDYLRSKPPGYYSIVHFDVHGVVRDGRPQLIFYSLIPELPIFEEEEASKIATELATARVSTVVLNACNSAKAKVAQHSNLAHTLIEAGVSTVVAMSYAVLSESAALFIHELYSSFLEKGSDMDLATFDGRQILRAATQRKAAFGLSRSLKDDFVPVLYKSYSGGVRWRPRFDNDEDDDDTQTSTPISRALVPPSDATFVGRDIDILMLEDMMYYSRVVHLYGPGGAGKTALARHLTRWWTLTSHFDYAFLLSCREIESFEEVALYRQLASLIQGSASSDSGPLALERCKRIVHHSSSIVFIDDCETTALATNVDDLPLRLLDNAAVIKLKAFLTTFCASSPRSRIILLSRTDAIGQIHTRNIRTHSIDYYELKPMRPSDMMTLLRKAYPTSATNVAPMESDTVLFSELLHFHDNNFLVASILAPCVYAAPAERLRLPDLEEALQVGLPPSALGLLNAHSAADERSRPSIILDFASVCAYVRRHHPFIHRVLLCFALFRGYCLNTLNLGPYMANLVGWDLLLYAPVGGQYRLSCSDGRRIGHDPERHMPAFCQQYPELRPNLGRAIKFMKVIGLIEEAIDLESDRYLKLHPLLPYLLRAEISRLEHSDAFMRSLADSFLDYWNFQASLFNDAGPRTVPNFMTYEWASVCCAINICIGSPAFGREKTDILFALIHLSKAPVKDSRKIEVSLDLLSKALSRLEELANRAMQPALPPGVLINAVRIVNIIRKLSSSWTLLTADPRTDNAVEVGVRLLENYKRANGELEAEPRCAELALKITLLNHKLERDEAVQRSLFQEIWEAQVPQDASDELAASFYSDQAMFVMGLLDDKTHMRRFSVTADTIDRRFGEILRSMNAEDLDTQDLELAWEMTQLKHRRDGRPFGLDGSDATEMISLLQSRGVRQLDETDPFSAGLLALASAADPHRARDILLNALQYAHLRDNVRDQRILHQMLFLRALEQKEFEHAVLHFDEMIKIDRSLAPGEGDERDSPQQQQQRYTEAWGNLKLGNCIIQTHHSDRESTQRERWSENALRYLERGRQLSLHWNFRDLQCTAWQSLGAWEVLMNKRPNRAFAEYAKAAMLGDEINSEHPDLYNRVSFAKGGYVRLLIQGWTRSESREKLSECVAAVVGWDAGVLQHFLERVYSSIWLDTPFWTEEPLDRFYEETQTILLDNTDDKTPLLFWSRNEGSAGRSGRKL